jgi:hypothetical protein
MRRLNILAEGQTEEGFVNDVLRHHLAAHGIAAYVRCVTTHRDRRRPDRVHRGGLPDYDKARRDLLRWMAEDGTAAFTTMFDLYALPEDFPGFEAAGQLADPYARVRALESAMYEDLGEWRLVPYIQLHEFEALLFAAPEKMDWEYLEHQGPIERLVEIASRYENPELINDGPHTAPSKRIIAEIPEYAFQKASVGPQIARQIGIEHMRGRCPHFSEWLARLEAS